jgi:hypothetical protein
MGREIIRKSIVMARTEGRREWSWGTLYAEHDNLTFDAIGNQFAPALQWVVQQHRWSEVTEIRWRRGFPFDVIEVASPDGVQLYHCFDAKRLARALQAIHARPRTRPRASYGLAA